MVSFAYESCNVRSKTFSVIVCPWSIIIICGSAFSLSENVSPSAEKGPRKCRVCSIRIHWHSSGPCCWRRRDLSKILLLSRRWNAFGLTKCSILFTLQPIAHILIIVFTVAILAQILNAFQWPWDRIRNFLAEWQCESSMCHHLTSRKPFGKAVWERTPRRSVTIENDPLLNKVK